MTYRPQLVKCWVCKSEIAVEDVKYHTSIEEGSPAKPFCGAECSLEYYKSKETNWKFSEGA